MPRSKHGQSLGPVDMAFYYVDSPQTPMNIGALTIYEGKIPFDPLRRMIDARIHQIPIYQQRIVQAPLGLGMPTWVYDPDFNIAKHVFWHELPPPGDDGQLQELAGHLVSGMLDRSRPLWEIHMIEGLAGDRTALLFKIHHCMVDGLAAIDLFTLLFDLTPEPQPLQRKPVYDPPPLPSGPEMVVDALARSIPNRWKLLRKLAEDVTTVGEVLGDKDKRRKMFMGMANLISDNLQPIRPLPINGGNTGRMAIAWADFSLSEVKAIKSARKSSVNDVMLSVLAGAIESYVRSRGGSHGQDSLRVLVPVSMRGEQERGDYGNRISVLPIDIPFGLPDPLERLRQVTEYTQLMKDSTLSTTLDMVLTMPSMTASWFQPLVWKVAPAAFSVIAHMWCTNVTGPQIPMYLLGHKLLTSIGFFPLNPSMGIACVIASYNQRIVMNIVADMGIVPEINDVRHHLYETYAALRRAANVPEIEPITLSRVRSGEIKTGPTPAKPAAPPPPPEPPKATPPPSAPEVVSVIEPAKTAEPVPESVSDSVPVAEAPAATEYAADAAPLMIDAPADETSSAPTSEASISAPNLPGEPDFAPGDAPTSAVPEASMVAPEPRPVEPTQPPDKPRMFSEPWARAYMKSINESESYYNASRRWEAGPLAFVMHPSPSHGYPEAVAVILDLHRGHCRGARSLSPKEAAGEASFVIEGDYGTWMEVLAGKAAPLAMIMRGKLRLTKGSMPRLLPFTQSAAELLNCAKTIT